ncbi:hypothetical protein HGG76_11820 [Ochrobactrum tritici]|uniref:DUF7146 domain-containing protein n=1 Tax=Brucella tritici TaxID=94626 RepID=A0A7X6JCY6_9HYPH|nr:hypothetical protein [Brucella tritici]
MAATIASAAALPATISSSSWNWTAFHSLGRWKWWPLAGVNLPGREETEKERRERFQREQDRKRRDEQRARQDQKDMERKTETVRSIWAEAKPIAGTLAEEYLRSRSIELADFPEGTEWMPSLRFHPGFRFKEQSTLP